MVSRGTTSNLNLNVAADPVALPATATGAGAARGVAVGDALRAWFAAIEPLWVGGLAVLCLLASWAVFSSPWLDLQGKTYDQAQYVVAGVAFPGLLFGVPLLWAWRGWPSGPALPIRRLLALGCLAAVAVLVAASMGKYGPGSELLPVGLAVAQTILMTRPWRREGGDARRTAVAFVVALATWTAAVSLFLQPLTTPPVFAVGFAAAFLLAVAANRDPKSAERAAPIRLWTPANFVALALIALMSLRTEYLFQVNGEGGALHHWGAWVGAADLIRQGGWLLWDAPSNYGFLNVLLFNALPTATPWQGFYLMQALAFVVVSGGFFLLLRALRPGWLNWLFALAVAVAIPMFMATFNPAGPVTATFIFPNWGAYRYVMCFVLLGILLWEAATDERSRRHGWVLVVGTVAWIVGVLWSTESAFFSSGAWLPAYAVIAIRKGAVGPGPWPRRAARAAAWLALPVAMAAATVAVIAAIYLVGLGHLPDWSATLDYVLEVGLNVLITVYEPVGGALGMLFGFVALAVGAWYAGTRAGLPGRSFGLWIGLLGAFWATNAYGYQRGGAGLHPVAYAALAVLLVLAARLPGAGGWGSVARNAAVPLLVLAMASPFAAVVANPLAIREAAASLATTVRQGFAVEPYLRDADPELQALLAEAGVGADDPIFYAGDWLGNLLLPWRPGGATDGAAAGGRDLVAPQWIPGHPSLALRWIPDGRGAVYVERHIERAPQSGWMIQNTTGKGSDVDSTGYAPGAYPWMFDLLRQTHVPTRIYESENWQLTWFEYVGDDPAVARPDYLGGRLGPLPPDVLVDGKPLDETAQPDVWTVFADGWGRFDAARGRTWRDGRARLWVYSPEAREVVLRLTRAASGSGTQLRVEAGGKATKLRWELGQTAEATVALDAGWTPIELSVSRRRAEEAPAAATDEPAAAEAEAEASAEAGTGDGTGGRDPAAGGEAGGLDETAGGGIAGNETADSGATAPEGDGQRAPRVAVERVEIVTQPAR